jgi:hypothetical protein
MFFPQKKRKLWRVATAKYDCICKEMKIYRKIGPFMFGNKPKQMPNGPPQSTENIPPGEVEHPEGRKRIPFNFG